MLIKVNVVPADRFTYDKASRTFTSALGNMPDKVTMPVDTEHGDVGFSLKGRQHTITFVLTKDIGDALVFHPAPEERKLAGPCKVVIYK